MAFGFNGVVRIFLQEVVDGCDGGSAPGGSKINVHGVSWSGILLHKIDRLNE